MSFNWGAAMAGAGEGLQSFLSDVQREQLMEASLKAHEAINIAAEGRAEERRLRETAAGDARNDSRRITPGTAEYDSAQKSQFELEKLAREKGLLTLRQTGTNQRPDGGFDTLDGAGKVQRTDAQGNLLGGAVDQTDAKGNLVSQGMDQRAYEGKSVFDMKAQDLDLSSKEKSIKLLEEQIRAAGAAALDRSETRANKKELESEIATLTHYLVSRAKNPAGDYTEQIASSAQRIAALGGNPQTMIEVMEGKPTTQTVATKTGDAALGQPVTTTTSAVKGAPVGGILRQQTPPDTGGGATLKGLIATAKARNYSPEKTREILLKQGYTDAQLKAAGL